MICKDKATSGKSRLLKPLDLELVIRQFSFEAVSGKNSNVEMGAPQSLSSQAALNEVSHEEHHSNTGRYLCSHLGPAILSVHFPPGHDPMQVITVVKELSRLKPRYNKCRRVG